MTSLLDNRLVNNGLVIGRFYGSGTGVLVHGRVPVMLAMCLRTLISVIVNVMNTTVYVDGDTVIYDKVVT